MSYERAIAELASPSLEASRLARHKHSQLLLGEGRTSHLFFAVSIRYALTCRKIIRIIFPDEAAMTCNLSICNNKKKILKRGSKGLWSAAELAKTGGEEEGEV